VARCRTKLNRPAERPALLGYANTLGKVRSRHHGSIQGLAAGLNNIERDAMGKFALDIAAWVAKAKENSDEVVRRVLQEVGDELLVRSPVGDRERWAINAGRKAAGLPLLPPGYVGGRFKGNWQLTIDEPASGTLPDIDPSGAASKARMLAAIPPQPAGSVQTVRMVGGAQ
jgi:hypothetical protein